MEKIVPYKKNYIRIYFDKECYFCNNYTRLIKLKNIGKKVELINLRNAKKVLPWFKNNGYDIDEGMVVTIDENIFFGSKAIYILSTMLEKKSLFNRLTLLFLNNQKKADFLYPYFVKIRNIFLKIKNIKKISH